MTNLNSFNFLLLRKTKVIYLFFFIDHRKSNTIKCRYNYNCEFVFKSLTIEFLSELITERIKFMIKNENAKVAYLKKTTYIFYVTA